MNKIKFDCALFFALEEEYNIVEKYKRIKKSNGYNYFNFVDKNGIKRSCVVDYVSKPSIHKAYKFTKSFIASLDIEIIFVIGLSGQLSDDLKLGDIVVANHIDWYDYDQKFNNGEIKFSGEIIKLERYDNVLSQINSNHLSIIKEWNSSSQILISELFNKVQIEQLENNSFIRKDANVLIKYGRVASGTSVVDDIEIKKKIIAKDRKLLCVDTESYGFADVLGNDSKIIIIRSVCDTADGRKKELDSFANNFDGIRRWSLDNAFRFFENILLKIIEFPIDGNRAIYSSKTIDKIDSYIDKNIESCFSCYSELFQEIILNINKEEFNFYETYTQKALDTSNSPIVVTGLPGSGKTTLLYSWYKYFIQNSIKCNYVNLHFFKKERTNNVLNDFKDEIKIIIKDEEAKVLIIDGLDEYERYFINQDVLINEYWSELSEKYKHIILGVTKQDFENKKDERRLFFVNDPKILISLTNFSLTKENTTCIIKNILKINKSDFKRINKIEAFINTTNLKEVDWHTANLIVKKIDTYNYTDINTLGELFHRHADHYFSKKKVLELYATQEASKMVFKKYIKKEDLTIKEYGSQQWIFIQQSNTVKQFLIAEYLIQQYINLMEKFDDSVSDLNYVYSYKINSYFKDNLNRSNDIQTKVFNSIESKYSALSIHQRQMRVIY